MTKEDDNLSCLSSRSISNVLIKNSIEVQILLFAQQVYQFYFQNTLRPSTTGVKMRCSFVSVFFGYFH